MPISKKVFSLPRAVGSFMLSRFALDTALRSPLPFLGVIAAAYGQNASAVSWLSIALSLAGLAAPITGILSQRFGQRRMVFIPLAAFVLACALLAVAPTFGSVLALFILLSVAKAMFDPQIQAFLGERVPYEKRGTVLGIVELSWALSFAIGAPAFGWLVDHVSWWAPFLLMGLIAALGLLAVWVNAREVMQQAQPTAAFSIAPWRAVWANRRARLLLLFMVGITIAAQLPYLVYPDWMRSHFNLTNAELGQVSIIIGVADLVAEILTIFLVDRIGKRRSVLIAGVFYALAFMLFWLLSNTLAGMVVALFCIYLGFEFTLVASLPIASEAVPEARAAMMGFYTSASALGRIIGSLVALPVFTGLGLGAVAAVGCISVALGVGFSASATSKTRLA